MAALSSILLERGKDNLWQTYMAELSWSMARTMYKEFSIPSYCELTRKSKQPEDHRTAQDIKAEVLAALGG